MLVLSREINNNVADDTAFAKRVTDCINRFKRKDWGDLMFNDDVTKNNQDIEALEKGEYGYVLASYGWTDKIWIIRDMEHTTVLFPREY